MSAGGDKERSRGRDDYETPPWLFKTLEREFDFEVDAAADESNSLCPKWYGPGGFQEDALRWEWDHRRTHWCNPPFDRMKEFMEHVVKQSGEIALLAPLAPDRAWYSLGAEKATEVRQFTHRVNFLLDGEPVRDAKGKKVGNTIGTALFVFRRHAPYRHRADIFMWDARARASSLGLL